MAPLRRKKPKQLGFERTYPTPIAAVWQAWTDPELLRRWWAPEHATVPDCAVDLRVGGTIRIVMEGGEGMGKYRGTRWPMTGTFTEVLDQQQLCYDAQSWTDGERETTTIDHTNAVTFVGDERTTTVRLQITITKIGPKAKMAAFGMKWGYKAYLDNLEALLARP